MTPKIDKLKNTGDRLVATIEGQDVELTTFREILIRNGLVYLPDPFGDRCDRMPYFEDPDDDESRMSYTPGCILDREVAAWMKEFAAGTLAKGMLRGF